MAEPPVVHVPDSQRSRYEKITATFKNKYGKEPEFFARAPGRVNLIGEHIDYCGYAVLPMAIEQDIVIAVALTDDGNISLSNTDETFQSHTCSTQNVSIDRSSPKWFHYFLCGFKGIVEHFSLDDPIGLSVIVDGTVPRSAGLSSSSAFVCSAALATMYANKKHCTKLELADICQHCERYIGTEGGGMDQSIAFLAEPGTARLIEFNPIRATDVILPPGAVFVISDCCIKMSKAITAHFNIRVMECRLAAKLLAKMKGLDWTSIQRLGDVQNKLSLTLKDMLHLVKETLHEEPYSKDEICSVLDITMDELSGKILNEKTQHVNSFLLYQRASHVYSEADRVLQFKETCDSPPERALEVLGRLMDDSHASCSKKYECSCIELDQLTELARQSGALGSRLTGAGWGGCAVSLVPSDVLPSFLQQMYDKYYAGDPGRLSRVKDSLFATQPGGGACIYIP